MTTKVQTMVTFGEGSDGKGQEGASGLLWVGAGSQNRPPGKNVPCSACLMQGMRVFYKSTEGFKRSGFCSFWPTPPLILTSPRERLCLTYFYILCIFHLEPLIPLRPLFLCKELIIMIFAAYGFKIFFPYSIK